MKLKYYLRGLGTGILFATIILSISFAVKNNRNDDEQETTTQQETTVAEETTTTETETATQKEETTTAIEETTTMRETTSTAENVSITVSSGMSSETVADLLKKAGAVDNSAEFSTYLNNNGYGRRISVGTYNIPSGASFEDIAKIITKSN